MSKRGNCAKIGDTGEQDGVTLKNAPAPTCPPAGF